MTISHTELFEILSTAIEDVDGDIESSDLISALMRVAAIVVSHAPDSDVRENIALMAINSFHLYVGKILEMEGKALTATELRSYNVAKSIFFDESPDSVN